jgi:hypothetical protein
MGFVLEHPEILSQFESFSGTIPAFRQVPFQVPDCHPALGEEPRLTR